MKRSIHVFWHAQTYSALGDKTLLEHRNQGVWRPMVDIYEQPDSITIVVDLPGVSRNAITVTAQPGYLSITGTRPEVTPHNTRCVHLMEIPHGPFARDVKLPLGCDMTAIEASYDQGCLRIRIPKEAQR